jgi:hypothetical protein
MHSEDFHLMKPSRDFSSFSFQTSDLILQKEKKNISKVLEHEETEHRKLYFPEKKVSRPLSEYAYY